MILHYENKYKKTIIICIKKITPLQFHIDIYIKMDKHIYFPDQ